MTHRLSRASSARSALSAALLASFAALPLTCHAQAADWQTVAAACTPDSITTLQNTEIIANGSAIRAPKGRNPPMAYTCNVLDSSAGTVPPWTRLRLQYFDSIGGAVSAVLYAKSKATAATSVVARVSSAAAPAIATVDTGLPSLDFGANTYYVLLTLFPQSTFKVQAHAVMLLQ